MTLGATIAEQPFTVAKIPVSSWSFAIRVWLTSRPLILAHPAYSDRLLVSRNLAQLAMLNSR